MHILSANRTTLTVPSTIATKLLFSSDIHLQNIKTTVVVSLRIKYNKRKTIIILPTSVEINGDFMNIPNNKRKKESMERIEKVFIELLQTKELNEISVSDICKRASLNRTTFYANYTDIYGLADAIRDKYDNNYKIIQYDTDLARRHLQNRFIECHMDYFKAGITQIIKIWLKGGCKESPEDMAEIIKSEYRGRDSFFTDKSTE